MPILKTILLGLLSQMFPSGGFTCTESFTPNHNTINYVVTQGEITGTVTIPGINQAICGSPPCSYMCACFTQIQAEMQSQLNVLFS